MRQWSAGPVPDDRVSCRFFWAPQCRPACARGCAQVLRPQPKGVQFSIGIDKRPRRSGCPFPMAPEDPTIAAATCSSTVCCRRPVPRSGAVTSFPSCAIPFAEVRLPALTCSGKDGPFVSGDTLCRFGFRHWCSNGLDAVPRSCLARSRLRGSRIRPAVWRRNRTARLE